MRFNGCGYNHKRVHRVYCEMKLNMKRRTKKRVITRQRQPLDCPTEINETWSLDFMRDTLYDGRPFKTLKVINEGNREGLLRVEVGRSISATRFVRVMNELIEFYGKPEEIRLKNDAELTSEAFTDWAKEHDIELRFIQPGKPNQNAFIERFNKSFRDEVLDTHLFNKLSEAQVAEEIWLEDYNAHRPHESLGRLPPAILKPSVCKPETSIFNL